MWFKIFAGISCESAYHGIYEFDNEEDALAAAWELACEDYDMYAGLHGIPSWEDCREDYIDSYGEIPSDDEVDRIYFDTRESWINYNVEEVDGPDADEEDE